MKKILFVLMLCVSMVACKKHEIEDVETTPMVTISFDQQLVSSNSMVRNTTNEFLDIIEEQTPDYVIVTLKNLDLDKTFTCKSNESITIPLGEYEISAESNGGTMTSGSGGAYYSIPKLKVNTNNIKITATTKEITLNAYYACYAVFALIDECKSVTGNFNREFPKNGKYYVCYMDDSQDAYISIIPYDDNTEFISTSYIFSTTYDVNKVYAEYGKYYVIHPQKVDKTVLDKYYLPTEYTDYYILKPEYRQYNCIYDKNRKEWLYADQKS